ncbi:hypothetical protein M514_17276 [Trichuris suis]|uniref:Uncharacterized protein n=1 Tax=Trichuris suis TaxID=68888 RepID=A0A085NLY7_9BILA|nr:hypothetical protein M514_17276 [Trichuris suis]
MSQVNCIQGSQTVERAPNRPSARSTKARRLKVRADSCGPCRSRSDGGACKHEDQPGELHTSR